MFNAVILYHYIINNDYAKYTVYGKTFEGENFAISFALNRESFPI